MVIFALLIDVEDVVSAAVDDRLAKAIMRGLIIDNKKGLDSN